MKYETERLLLRRWEEEDAEQLYQYASDPDVASRAGWQPHKNVEESRWVIQNVLCGAEAYAICLKTDGRAAIGAIKLKQGGHTRAQAADECELGYWLGKPFWGQGLMTEAVREMLRHAFEDLDMRQVWCAYCSGNHRSQRVQEKAGFRLDHTNADVYVPGLQETHTEHVSLLTRDGWDWARMYEAAKAVQNGRKISDYVEAGGVAAAVLSASGKIYTGVCVDTCSTLGICAERNAIFQMITNGEQEIRKVLAIMSSGRTGAPCGACRELMVQLMPKTYQDIQVMMDYQRGRTVSLGELTPEWWI